jgi:7-cyano-7-deazaguanine synthase in queuosine biosynthesis
MEREHHIFCGGIAPGRRRDGVAVLRLNLWGGSKDDNVVLHISDIHERLLREVPEAFHDLSEIAAYVYCADQFITRIGQDADSFGGKWRRRMHFQIPVRRPDVWQRSDVQEQLVDLLEFLSDDHYTFTFKKAASAPAFQQYLGFAHASHPADQPDGVVMFSGGLDSLAGLVDEALLQKRRVVAVTHKSTNKNSNVLRHLNSQIAEKAGHLAPSHMAVRVHKSRSEARDYTQRTRSFLFASIGATVARMVGVDHLRFYENGVVSLNLPLCTQVVGGRATRTTHPRVIDGFQKLFSLIGDSPFIVENPYLWKTKAEVIDVLLKHGHGNLIASSISCAHTWERSNEFTHCGTCSQCIDRRIAIVAARAQEFDPETHYRNDVFAGSRPKNDDKIMLAEFLERAFRFEGLSGATDLICRFPTVVRAIEPLTGNAMSNAERVLDLCKRHAREVKAAVSAMFQQHSEGVMLRTLPPECLVRIVTESSSTTTLPVPVGGPQNPRNYLWQRGNVWEARFNGGQPILIQKHRKGCVYLQSLLSAPFAQRNVFEVVAVDLVENCGEVAMLDPLELKTGYQITQGMQRSDLGVTVDQRALDEYKRSILELLEDLREARENNDEGRKALLEEEIAKIEQARSAGSDHKGQPRKVRDARKNVRDAFRNSVNRAIEEISEHDSVFGEHLQAYVKLGAIVDYTPEPQVAWSTRPPL